MSEAEPREGLPPCVSVAVFEDRRVFMRDNRECKHNWNGEKRQIVVTADTFADWGPDYGMHEEARAPHGRGREVLQLWTNDPDEATAAFEKGAKWVRTGELA